MAKYSRGKKIEPAIMTMTMNTPDTTGGDYTIDLSQCASILNRRVYRQGIAWVVDSFKVFSSSTGTVQISKIPTSWVSSGAWKKAQSAWLRQQNEALENLDEVAPARFRDFKIFLDDTHVTATYANNLLPLDAQGNAFVAGEWEESQIVIPNDGAPGVTNEYSLHMVGANVAGTSMGLITNYANSRNMPFSPDPVHPTPLDNNMYNSMFDKGMDNDDVINNATDRNDHLPYNQDTYPGEPGNGPGLEWHDITQIVSYSTGVGNVASQKLKGGVFPCGLVRLTWTPQESANIVIQVNLVPGNHRGYLCEKMQDM